MNDAEHRDEKEHMPRGPITMGEKAFLEAHAEMDGQPFNDPPPTIIEGGLHVRVSVEMLKELVPHLPRTPRGPMATWWFVSATNTPELRDRITQQEGLRDAETGLPVVLTHAQTSFCITDVELRQFNALVPPKGRSMIEFVFRERAQAALAGLKDYSPGCTDIHWIGPSRGPAPQEATDGSQAKANPPPAL